MPFMILDSDTNLRAPPAHAIGKALWFRCWRWRWLRRRRQRHRRPQCGGAHIHTHWHTRGEVEFSLTFSYLLHILQHQIWFCHWTIFLATDTTFTHFSSAKDAILCGWVWRIFRVFVDFIRKLRFTSHLLDLFRLQFVTRNTYSSIISSFS